MSQRPTWSADLNRTRLEDLTWMTDAGESLDGAARRLGLTLDTLEKWCDRQHHRDLWDRLTRNTDTPGHGARHGRTHMSLR